MLALIQAAATSPFDWASNHLHIIGWPALVYFAWRVGTYFQSIKHKFEATVEQIDTMACNHFPHMEASLTRQDGYLENMDKNIARMADKL